MPTIAELRTTRNNLLLDAQKIVTKQDVNKEERSAAQKMIDDADALEGQIAVEERLAKVKSEERSISRVPRGQPGSEGGQGTSPEQTKLEMRAFSNYITGRLTPEDHQYLRTDTRDLTVGSPGATTGGGVLVPIGYDETLHVATKSVGEILNGVRTWNTDSGEGIQVSLTDPSSLRFALVNEMATVGTTTPAFNGFNSYVDTLGFSTKVSNQLLQDSAFSVSDFLSEVIATAWVATASEAIIGGNGSNFQSLVSGASVGYTAPSGDVAALTYADLLNTYKALDPSYHAGAAWWCNSRTWAAMMNVLDSTGRPILTADLQGGPFKTLFGLPIRFSQSIADLGAGNAPILLGDAARSYTYRQAGPLLLRRASELFIGQNATGFYAFQRAGGYVTSQSTSPSMIKLVMAAS